MKIFGSAVCGSAHWLPWINPYLNYVPWVNRSFLCVAIH